MCENCLWCCCKYFYKLNEILKKVNLSKDKFLNALNKKCSVFTLKQMDEINGNYLFFKGEMYITENLLKIIGFNLVI